MGLWGTLKQKGKEAAAKAVKEYNTPAVVKEARQLAGLKKQRLAIEGRAKIALLRQKELERISKAKQKLKNTKGLTSGLSEYFTGPAVVPLGVTHKRSKNGKQNDFKDVLFGS